MCGEGTLHTLPTSVQLFTPTNSTTSARDGKTVIFDQHYVVSRKSASSLDRGGFSLLCLLFLTNVCGSGEECARHFQLMVLPFGQLF